MGSIVETVNYQTIIDHLFSAQKYWYAALPGIYDELAEGIIEAKRRNPNLEIEIIIDSTESSFRSHHGSIDAIHSLINSEISVKQIPNHRLGFFMSEESGWFLFTQSRAIEKEPLGFNAIQINDISKHELLYYFFEKESEPDLIISHNPHSNYKTGKEVKPQPLDDVAFYEVSESLESNPPPSPDFKRVFDVYSTKIKFIEFEVKGINLHQKMVSIPNDILNLVDENLRNQIKTRLNIFDEYTQKKIEDKLIQVEKEVSQIREKYLKRVASRKKSVLHAKHLQDFNQHIESLKVKYSEVQESIEIDIWGALISLEERLKAELLKIYENAPPNELIRFRGEVQYPRFLKNYVEKIAMDIKLPSLEKLMNSFEVNKRIFNPTYEDFKDKNFIEELEKIGFIDKAEQKEIVDEFNAIGVQPNEGKNT